MTQKAINTMTEEELKTAAKEYDEVQNEGGEGYNPYHDALNARRREATASKPKSIDEQIMDLNHRIDRECNPAMRRNSPNPEAIEEKARSLQAQVEELKQQKEAAFAAEWTMEVTEQRRADWNAMVKSGKFGTKRIDGNAVAEQVRKQGWGPAELKKAIALHDLD